MIYAVVYDMNGNPCAVSDGASFIPLSEDNADFRRFLEWNITGGLDWQTPITVEIAPPAPTQDTRLTALEDAVISLMFGGV